METNKTDNLENHHLNINKTIVVVDDEPDLLNLVNLHLTKTGYKVKCFEDAKSLFVYLNTNIPDLIILDLMLPDADGFDICKILKKDDRLALIPVIMLTAKSDEMDKIIGLELGADDYVTKPFSPRELMARVKVVLRREINIPNSKISKISDVIEINHQKYEVYVANERIELTSSEYKILKLLTERKGWVYSREQILDYLGAIDKGVLDRTVDVHIKNLREKLGVAGKLIKNIRGIGYKLEV